LLWLFWRKGFTFFSWLPGPWSLILSFLPSLGWQRCPVFFPLRWNLTDFWPKVSQTDILLISASQADRITGVSYPSPAGRWILIQPIDKL
jgi:hypothetical protein